MKYIEKYIDLTDIDAVHQINNYIANGWFIHYTGLTLCILHKFIKGE